MDTPRFSILTPVYETPEDVLRKMLRSVLAQTCEDWELCLVDDGSKQGHVREILERARALDPRIRVQLNPDNGGIVAASNDALAMARGEFVAMLDHDDELHPDALTLVGEALDRTPEADYVYTDEDKIDRRGRHSSPFFKPDWSPERMRTQMYTCHLSVMRRSLVEEVGGFDQRFEGSQDWDLVLRVTERARAVLHVARILYHWRILETSAAGGEEAKPWAFEAGQRAVQAHCERIGLQARVELDDEDPGVLHLQPELRREPLVSIVIPTGGHSREIRFEPGCWSSTACAASSSARPTRTTRSSASSTARSAREVIDELRRIAGERLRLVALRRPLQLLGQDQPRRGAQQGRAAAAAQRRHRGDDPGLARAHGDVLRAATRSAPSAAGCCGGTGASSTSGSPSRTGLPGHTYRGYAGDFKGYANAIRIARNCLAVTGACLMTPRALFEELGGLTSTLPVNFNDIDYCLKVYCQRPPDRLRPRPDPLPLRVLQPRRRRRRLGEGTPGRALGAGRRPRPLRQPAAALGLAEADLARPLGAAATAAQAAGDRTAGPGPMNYERLYSYRFRDIDQDGRAAVWNEIAPHVHGLMGSPAEGPRPGRRARRVHRRGPSRGDLGGRRGQLPRGGPQAGHEGDHLPDHGRRAARRATSTASTSPTSSSTSTTRRRSPPSSKR